MPYIATNYFTRNENNTIVLTIPQSSCVDYASTIESLSHTTDGSPLHYHSQTIELEPGTWTDIEFNITQKNDTESRLIVKNEIGDTLFYKAFKDVIIEDYLEVKANSCMYCRSTLSLSFLLIVFCAIIHYVF